MPPPAALENKHEGEMQEPPPVPAGTFDMADAANAMEAFLSTPLSLEAVSLLFTSVEVGTLFGLLDAEQSTAQLASDCVRRAFNHEVGMDVLESAGVAELLPVALALESQRVREALLGLLSGLALAQPARLRALLIGSAGLLPLVTARLADESVGVSEETQRLFVRLAAGDGDGAAEFLPTLLMDGGLDALAADAPGLLRIRLASLLIKLGTSPAVADGFRLCVESGRLDGVLGLAALAGGGDVDLLELLSSYELLSELGACGAGWAYLDSQGVLDRLLALSAADPDSMEGMLQPGALQFFASTIETVRAIPAAPCCRRCAFRLAASHGTHTCTALLGHRLAGCEALSGDLCLACLAVGAPSFWRSPFDRPRTLARLSLPPAVRAAIPRPASPDVWAYTGVQVLALRLKKYNRPNNSLTCMTQLTHAHIRTL